jgi:spoIIIJ-associated protein
MSGSDEVRSGIPTAIEDLDEDGRRAHDVVEELLQQIGVDAALEIVRLDSNDLQVNIIGEDLGFLIGKHGQTLYSIQYLINTIINRPELESTTESGARPVRVLLDSGGYRERRLQTLQSIARNAASKARTRGRRVRLDPLPSHERRIIHMTLADDTSVKTFSEGRDPNRHVIIEPTAQPRPRVVDHDRTPGVAAPRPKRVSTWGRPRPARQPFDTRLFDDMFADPKSPPRKPPSGESDEQGPSKEESG